ncbi:hypothetical protein BDQ17DRAFT_1381504 [Cyathus striatus]|nr:hypothetical protein BDQ17DRAFT_1381504 [Cyathus striatus]
MVEFTVTKPINIEAPTSSIQFPIGSRNFLDSPRATSRSRPGAAPYGNLEVTTPFIRSHVHSRLDSVANGEPGLRTRRESSA